MMVAEWGGLITLLLSFYFISGKSRQILAVHCEVEMAEQIWPSMCQHHENHGIHYAW
jgi:hypothetical protein